MSDLPPILLLTAAAAALAALLLGTRHGRSAVGFQFQNVAFACDLVALVFRTLAEALETNDAALAREAFAIAARSGPRLAAVVIRSLYVETRAYVRVGLYLLIKAGDRLLAAAEQVFDRCTFRRPR